MQRKNKRWPKVVGIILGVCALIYGVMALLNLYSCYALRNYIKTFEPIAYSDDRIVPKMEDGYMTITTDSDLRVMHIADIHIGGGIWSLQNDKKSVYELITMLQAEKPDIVVLGGDNTYCVPGLFFNGGFTNDNERTAKTLINVFEHEQVYFTTVLGNHDTESFDYASRQDIGDLYMSDYSSYCFFDQNFTDLDADTVPSVSNQIIVVKKTNGEITKLILLIDTNAYVDTSFLSTALGKYDVIHDAQVDWAKGVITDLSKKAGLSDGEYLKTICFLHIPVGEYRNAVDDLITEVKDEEGKITAYIQNDNPQNTQYLWGVWDESICYGGRNNPGAPEDQDQFFEVLCDEMHSVEAVFCGHDHVNNGVVFYKGVMLAYGYSVDNEAYGQNIRYSGTQRGATIVTISYDGSFSEKHKNAYTDYGCETDRFVDVYLDKPLYESSYRTVR